MDISTTTQPKSDQQNFDDYQAGAKTVTISEVRAGSAEQPVEIHLAEFPGRPFKPSKSMRRVLVACWGAEASTYTGRRMTLYGDPTVKFGGATVGGIRISHLSHIDKPVSVNLTVTRGKRSPTVIQPLPATTAHTPAVDRNAEFITAISTADTIDALQAVWVDATSAGVTKNEQIIAAKDARKNELLGA